ncbi:5-oxopent-3-ene-1,2,5-tricarboxylate decarboxylase [Pseudomonas syringae pv. papulans]|nr:5-oxopent-3-ene-1,2,5-tricarboxylate decarboxylase [Pseudomonas syringae pv. papulans]RMN45716.1 5-oxopent-3-ene-1,2,5-tricarboxylate decarboxylase [Pseudomonas syringae pv. papulans]RMN83738.1 5-oxopent-3-ene-1,2,5-tricarboxylate decarboxylase [Pseudomonas syringae pv. papulans]RMV49619.1 5-oxopent-3-ene-1,2,5-tricarboxylate decarboxylase [Pseudomonas syringae pv. papulans]
MLQCYLSRLARFVLTRKRIAAQAGQQGVTLLIRGSHLGQKRENSMKLLRYGEKGLEKPGLLDANNQIRDLSAHIRDIAGEALSPASLASLAAIDPASLPLVSGQPRIGACVGQVGKFICIGLNYADHAAESQMDVPKEPIIFNKWTSAICGPNDDVQIPRGSLKTDWEVELGVIIGKGGRYIDEADAMEHVAGYCVINDVSEREWQLERGGTWDKGKGFDTFGPLGPWLVTRDEIADPHSLDLWLEVDGHRYQNGNTRTLIFSVPQLIAYLSRCMSLQPGDVISTGTPPGVGLGVKPQPVFLRAGQRMRLGITGLGEQNQLTVPAD